MLMQVLSRKCHGVVLRRVVVRRLSRQGSIIVRLNAARGIGHVNAATTQLCASRAVHDNGGRFRESGRSSQLNAAQPQHEGMATASPLPCATTRTNPTAILSEAVGADYDEPRRRARDRNALLASTTPSER